MPTPYPSRVSIVVPTFNGKAWLEGCLPALAAQTVADFEIVVVDNGSADGTAEFLRAEHPHVRLIALETNVGFAPAVNRGIAACRGEFVALLNNDTLPAPTWLERLLQAADREPAQTASFASCMLRMDQPDQIDSAGDVLSWHGCAAKRGHGQPAARFAEDAYVFSPCAGAALYRRDALEKVGPFADHYFAYLEDVDLGLRLQLAGYRCLYVADARVLHAGHGSAIPGPLYVRLMTANRLRTFLRNLPARLLLRHVLSIAYGQFFYFVMYRRPWASLRGYFAFLRRLPLTLAERKRIRAACVLDLAAVDRLLVPTFLEPRFRDVFRDALAKVFHAR
jgi:GT2 family glycosyltransferase